MGYTTRFDGQVRIDPPVSMETYADVADLAESTADLPGAPTSYFQWEITRRGDAIRWDGGEKFYDSVGWMRYLIDNYLAPNGHVCNGVIKAQGEDAGDAWELHVVDNVVTRFDPLARLEGVYRALKLVELHGHDGSPEVLRTLLTEFIKAAKGDSYEAWRREHRWDEGAKL